MDIIVEDGLGVPNANSYVSVEDAVAYAEQRGWERTFSNEDKVAVALIRAMDYLNSIDNYKGRPLFADQRLPWPRTRVVVNRITLPFDEIPLPLRQAQIELANAILNGVELFPLYGKKLESSAVVKKEKVGPLETEFFEPKNPTFEQVSVPLADALLAGLRVNYSALRTIRV